MQARVVVRVLARDPVLLIVVVVGALAAGWLLPGFGTPASAVLIAALLAPISDVVIGRSAYRLARLPGTPVAARRFWIALTALGGLWGIGDTGQIVYVLSHPGLTDAAPSDFQSVFSLTGIAVPVLVMLTYPQVSPTREARIRFWLDAGAVLTAAAVIMWYLTGESAEGAIPESAVALIAAFAAARLLLSGSAPMSTIAAAPVLVAAALQCYSGAISSHAAAHLPMLVTLEVVAPAVMSLGPRIQELLVRHAITAPARRARPYSLLPYAMLVLVFALLPLALPHDLRPTAVVTLAGLTVVTSLVVLRQLVVFGEFNRVVGALDASLLEARELEERLRYQTQHDSLTGLANRALFGERLAEVVPAGAAVLHIDLDGFKIINDSYGHHAGDAVLIEVAARLRASTPPGGLAARLGGDEFAILLPGDETAVAEAVAERFRTLLRLPVDFDGRLLAVGASIGLAAGAGGDPETLLRRADEQMYRTKHRSRTQVSPADADV
jgi:diguanylate cyclase (GGDEF)-like protein